MDPGPRPLLTLILPAYNEAAVIARTLAQARAHLDAGGRPYEILVVADGDDGTREAAQRAAAGDVRILVSGQARRCGKGRAVREAVARARGELVGFADADGKVPFAEMDRLLACLEDGADVAVGSRVRPDSRIERPARPLRRVASRAFAAAVRVLVPLGGIRDTQCGFKFFRIDAARAIFARQRVDGYMFDVEVLRLARRAGLTVREVGVRWSDDGDSRLDLRGNWRNVIDLLRIALSR